MTKAEFVRQLGRLNGLKYKPETAGSHWEVLGDLALDDLTRAIGVALHECASFPSPAEILAIAHRTAPALPPPTRQEWRDYCDRCRDTGWESKQCPEQSCGRTFDHTPHEFVIRCACWTSNPTLLRRRDRMSQQATHRTAKADR